MHIKNSFEPAFHRYLIQDRGMATIKKNCHLLNIIEEKSGVPVYKVKTQKKLGTYELILKDSANNVLVKIRQHKFHLHPTFTVWSMSDDGTNYQVNTIKRKSIHSRFHHYTDDSIYGGFDLIETIGQEPSFHLTNTKCLIAQGSKKFHSSTYVNIKKGQNEQFILALFILALGL